MSPTATPAAGVTQYVRLLLVISAWKIPLTAVPKNRAMAMARGRDGVWRPVSMELIV
jgi:hypothetical protein